MDYANLITLDLAEFDQPGGKERLAAQLKQAAHEIGTFPNLTISICAKVY